MRHTRSHTANRRSHHALKKPTLSKCSHCGADHRPHHMCLECGFYNGRQVMDLAAEKAKREARIKATKERIKTEMGSAAAPEIPGHEEKEKIATKDEHIQMREEKLQTKRPDKHREAKSS